MWMIVAVLCGRCRYRYHCLNILVLCINNECTLIQAKKKNSLCKNITLIIDNDYNNCICCFENDLFIFGFFVYHFVCSFVYIIWIHLFIIHFVPSKPSLIDISSMLIFIMYARTG